MDIPVTLQLTGAVTFLTAIYWLHGHFKGDDIPGPSPHPFVGHTFQVETVKQWKYFENLWRRFGPITRVTLAGTDIVVLSDPEDAEELLARRSKIYSSRRPLIYAGKYESNNMRLSLLPYGEMLKRQRGAFHNMLQPKAIGGYEHYQHMESLRLLVDLVKTPTDFYHHIQRFPASLIFRLAFGVSLSDDNKDLDTAIQIFSTFVKNLTPGMHLVDTFPILDMLPDFLAPWRARAKKEHEREIELYGRLSMQVKARMETDPGLECFTARLWEQQKRFNIPDEELFYVAGSAFIAGTDTSSLTLLWWVMAMALYPLTMAKAQAEIDSVFDSHTLPDFSRMQDLPYCAALIKEILRWAPAAPLSIPHYLDEEDQYKGYTIRKGSVVISSIWNMHHNEEEYPNPYLFDPERFVNPKSNLTDTAAWLNEGHYGFGFGRRKCPGNHLAAKSTWISIVRMLWAFNIEHRKDAWGNPIRLDPEDCTSGLTSRPKPFPVDFIPRSAAHVETILASEERT
ncbi:cytochrome P450 [Favolaschia claudopus]|uniref:Cytochrome P450 n=1 Tax=Favolaschia claudopus TaxID=2862362 RepID=A0AAW0DQA7_9AGAR